MFEPKTKNITRWGLTIRGADVYFPKKETAIHIGKLTLKMNPETQMFEEYRLWDLTSGVPQLVDEQRFDRTILIQNSTERNKNMARTIYENIGVEFVLEEVDEYEAKIKVNDKTLIYISREQEAEFEEELKKLFDKYRI